MEVLKWCNIMAQRYSFLMFRICQVIALMVIYMSVISHFGLMKRTLMHKALAFQYLLRALVMGVTVSGDKT